VTTFRVRFEGQETYEIEADSVAFKEGGVVAFYNQPNPEEGRLTSSDDLIQAFSEWESVKRVEIERFET